MPRKSSLLGRTGTKVSMWILRRISFMSDGYQRRGLYYTATLILMAWYGLARPSLGTRYPLVGACRRPRYSYWQVDASYKHPQCPLSKRFSLGFVLVGFAEIPTLIKWGLRS